MPQKMMSPSMDFLLCSERIALATEILLRIHPSLDLLAAPTAKYGIIYQTKIISNSNGRIKGKMSRALASKAALCTRLDALAEEED